MIFRFYLPWDKPGSERGCRCFLRIEALGKPVDRMSALQELTAVVVRLFPEEGEGFLKTPHEQEIHFHRHAFLQGDFNRLAVGTEVRYTKKMGEEEP